MEGWGFNSSVIKPSLAFVNLGIVGVILGLVLTCCCGFNASLPGQEQGFQVLMTLFALAGLGVIGIGAAGILYFLLFYKLRPGYGLISGDEIVRGQQWRFGRLNPDHLIRIERKTLTTPSINLRLPDDGKLTVKLAITYQPDDFSSTSLETFRSHKSCRGTASKPHTIVAN
ncbi:MAG: hypothetical protein QM785_17825 [Pyrinomonadaceae bacterium]